MSTSSKDSLSEILWLMALTTASFVVRNLCFAFPQLDFVTWDGAYYINYFRDTAWQWVLHPGYPFFIEAVRVVSDMFGADGVLAARVVSFAFGSALVIPVYYIARRFMSRILAVSASAVIVLNPWMIRFSTITYSESVYIFFMLYTILAFLENRPIRMGLMAGIAYLIRPEALIVAGSLLLYQTVRRNKEFVVKAAIPLVLLMLPYVVYLYATHGELTITPKTMNVRTWSSDWRVNVGNETLVQKQESLSSVVVSAITSYPERMFGYLSNILKYAGVPLVILAVFGIVKCKRFTFDRQLMALWSGLVLLPVLPFFGLNVDSRFVLPFFPILAIFAMYGIYNVRHEWARLVLFGAVIIGPISTMKEMTQMPDYTPELRTAGMEFAPFVKKGDAFMDRKPYLAFYAGGRFISIPNEAPETVFKLMEDNAIKYLVLAERVIPVFRPQLLQFMYDQGQWEEKGFRLDYVLRPGTGQGVIILQKGIPVWE